MRKLSQTLVAVLMTFGAAPVAAQENPAESSFVCLGDACPTVIVASEVLATTVAAQVELDPTLGPAVEAAEGNEMATQVRKYPLGGWVADKGNPNCLLTGEVGWVATVEGQVYLLSNTTRCTGLPPATVVEAETEAAGAPVPPVAETVLPPPEEEAVLPPTLRPQPRPVSLDELSETKAKLAAVEKELDTVKAQLAAAQALEMANGARQAAEAALKADTPAPTQCVAYRPRARPEGLSVALGYGLPPVTDMGAKLGWSKPSTCHAQVYGPAKPPMAKVHKPKPQVAKAKCPKGCDGHWRTEHPERYVQTP